MRKMELFLEFNMLAGILNLRFISLGINSRQICEGLRRILRQSNKNSQKGEALLETLT